MMKWKRMTIAAATLVAVAASWTWGLAIRLWPISVLSGTDESEVHIIRRVMPHHIVNPASIRPPAGQDLTITWLLQETKVRMLIIWTLWAVMLAAIIMIKKRTANNTSEGICQPADGLPKPST